MRILAAALALGACTATAGGPSQDTPVAIEADSIRYETGPCFGACPVYAVTVRPDRNGLFEGKNFTAVTGTREFRLTRAQYDRFAALLAPHRPETGAVRYSHGEPNCRNAPTDMPSVEVTWTRAIGDSQSLYYYFGCDDENPGKSEALQAAAKSLPIAQFIGDRR